MTAKKSTKVPANVFVRTGVDVGPYGPVLDVRIFEPLNGEGRMASSFILDLTWVPALVNALLSVWEAHKEQLDSNEDNRSHSVAGGHHD